MRTRLTAPVYAGATVLLCILAGGAAWAQEACLECHGLPGQELAFASGDK